LSAAVLKVLAGFMELFPGKLMQFRHGFMVTFFAILVFIGFSPVRAED
jgi:hypothetical protein